MHVAITRAGLALLILAAVAAALLILGIAPIDEFDGDADRLPAQLLGRPEGSPVTGLPAKEGGEL